jgi:predicted metalloprotease with PDZ domain
VFRDTYGQATGLGARIRDFRVIDEAGNIDRPVANGFGQFNSAISARKYAFYLMATVPAAPEGAVFASWVSNQDALLMLGDLLPLTARGSETNTPNLELKLIVPAGWAVSSAESSTVSNVFAVNDVASAVFAVGADLRELTAKPAGISTRVSLSHTWAFADSELLKQVDDIMSEHARIMDPSMIGRAAVILLPFPATQPPQRWSAETRGHTVILLSGRQPAKGPALSQLSVSLTHELMHLWVPNALKLKGSYDWFYEGFTVYRSICVGVKLGYLEFQDYLNALARAFDEYEGQQGRDANSLLKLTEKRWAGAERLLYSKGLLVAFLYDLNLRFKTGNNQSLDDVYKYLTRKPPKSISGADGNRVVVQALCSFGKMDEFVTRYIESASEIDLEKDLIPFGLAVDRGPVRTRVGVAGHIGERQKALLKKLGYTIPAR